MRVSFRERSPSTLAVYVGLALVAALSAHLLLKLAIASGGLIPQDDLTTDYALGVLWAAALGLALAFSPLRQRDREMLAAAWLIKAFITLVFMFFYEASYDLDAYEYFAGPHRPWYSWNGFSFGLGTDNVMALSWLQQQVIPHSYHALKVSSSFVGLMAVYLFFRAVEVHDGRQSRRLFFFLLLSPTVLFWSSILGKDPIILFGIALHALGLVMWYRERSAKSALIAFVGLAIATIIRPWLAPILIAPLAIVALGAVNSWRRKAAIVAAALAAIAPLVIVVARQFKATSLQSAIQALNLISRAWATGGSGQARSQDFSNLGDMLLFLPRGAFAALFRPLPGEIMNAFGLLAGLENLALLSLVALAVIRMKRVAFADPIARWALVFVVSWTTLYAFISYQNLGTAVRFKMQILPVLLLLLVHLLRRPRASARRVDHTRS